MVKCERNTGAAFPSPQSSSRRLDPDLIAEMARSRPDEPTATTEDVLVSEISVDEEESTSKDQKYQNVNGKKRNLKWVRRRTVCGTAGYRPPEQVQERFLDYFSRIGYDERADWFSLGVCCYTMLTGRRPFPTRKELLQSDSQRQNTPLCALPSNNKVNNDILEKVLNDAEYQCLMFEVQYPDYFSHETDAKVFVDSLLARNPDERPRYNEIVKHPWLKSELFEEQSILKRAIPDWVKDHTYLQSQLTLGRAKSISRRASQGMGLWRGSTLSDCIDNLCSECFEKNDSIYAENFTKKWTTKARERNLTLFRHWNYMSDDSMKLEISASKKKESKLIIKN